jgi:hypothetical protein
VVQTVLGYLGEPPNCIADRKVSAILWEPSMLAALWPVLAETLGIDSVKPEDAELCGDDPVSKRVAVINAP